MAKDTYVNVQLFADDLILIQDSKDKLQRSVFRLNQTRENYNFKIQITETKVTAFIGKNTARSKAVTNDKNLEQVTYLKYLGCNVS
jgi:hypothetical protein